MTSTLIGCLQKRPWHVSGWDWGSSDADNRIRHRPWRGVYLSMSLRLSLLSKGYMTLRVSSRETAGRFVDAMRRDGYDEEGVGPWCCTTDETGTLQRAEAKIHEMSGTHFSQADSSATQC